MRGSAVWRRPWEGLGLAAGDAVATFAWNNRRHHELYWATANTGLICHTINIRLFADQVAYIVNHAGDRVLFVDPDLVPLLAPVVPQLETVVTYVVMGAEADDRIPGSIAYEDLIAEAPEHGSWPELDERSPMMLCYTLRDDRQSEGGRLHPTLHLHAHHLQPRQLLDGPAPTTCSRWSRCSTRRRGATPSWPSPRGQSSLIPALICRPRVWCGCSRTRR